MKLPVSSEYLATALQAEGELGDFKLIHHQAGDLLLPTGQLVASDPQMFPEREAFTQSVPRGSFPVILSIAQIGADQRVAYATVRFKPSRPVDWKLMTVEKEDISSLKDGEVFGYPVDSGTGCFMDRSIGRVLTERIGCHQKTPTSFLSAPNDEAFYDMFVAALRKKQQPTWTFMDLSLENANLVVFSSGYGDGYYATYAGFDSSGELSAVVTDFDVMSIAMRAA